LELPLQAGASEKQTQYANRAKAFAPHQNFGPAISEAAEPRCGTFGAIKLPNTPRWSEAASLEVAKIFRPIWDDNPLPENCELCRKAGSDEGASAGDGIGSELFPDASNG
jgi:hypothetical protein